MLSASWGFIALKRTSSQETLHRLRLLRRVASPRRDTRLGISRLEAGGETMNAGHYLHAKCHMPPNSALQRTAGHIKCLAAGGQAKSTHERWRARVLRGQRAVAELGSYAAL